MKSIKVIVVSSAATYRKGGPDLSECPAEIFQQATFCHLLRDYERQDGYFNKNIRLYDSDGNDLGTYGITSSRLRVLDGGYVVEDTAPADLYIIPKNRHSNYPIHFSG